MIAVNIRKHTRLSKQNYEERPLLAAPQQKQNTIQHNTTETQHNTMRPPSAETT